MDDMLTIEELIAHCDRELHQVPRGSIFYREHESVKGYLKILKSYIDTRLTPKEVGSLKAEVERLHRENFWLTSEREPVPGWIAMVDKLPPEDGSYIVCTKLGAVCTAHFNVKTGRWGHSMYGVTHWMPLPKAPEKGR